MLSAYSDWLAERSVNSKYHSRPQSPLFFGSVPRTRTLATAENTRSRGSGIVEYSGQISENAQKSRKSVIRGLPASVMARVRDLGADQKKSCTNHL